MVAGVVQNRESPDFRSPEVGRYVNDTSHEPVSSILNIWVCLYKPTTDLQHWGFSCNVNPTKLLLLEALFLLPSFDIWRWQVNLPVKPSRPQQSWIKYIRSVCTWQYYNICSGAETWKTKKNNWVAKSKQHSTGHKLTGYSNYIVRK